MLGPLILLLIGFMLLMWAADRFVYGAAHLARNLNVSPMLIGVTIVAMGTSAPEVVVSVIAALKGSPELALGNAIGSNIANIGLIVGITALIAPLDVSSSTLRKEFPLLFAITLLTILLMSDAQLQFYDGVILLLGMVLLLVWLIVTAQRPNADPLAKEYGEELKVSVATPLCLFWLTVGLVAMPVCSNYLIVNNAIIIAQYFEVSHTFIGLTLVAIGTSLPELATSTVGAWKGEHDLALGNIIGSNMFNMLVVLSLPVIISPFPVEHEVLWRDLPVMSGLTIILFLMAFGLSPKGGRINRWEGLVLLAAYVAYLTTLVMGA